MKIADEISRLAPYIPGKPIEEVQRELGLSRVIKLASNENPLGPSPKVLKVLKGAIVDIHLYPDGSCHDLRHFVADQFKVPADQILFGSGSNDLIDLVARTFCERGDEILTFQYSFIAYKISGQAARASVMEIPVGNDFEMSLEALAKRVSAKTRVVFLANPNNPTGTYLGTKTLDVFLAKFGRRDDLLIVLDEAYCEYVRAKDYPDALELLKKYPNLVVFRTFSKAYGLAGLRLGTMFADRQVVDYVNRVRLPFNVNSLVQKAAIAALKDQDYVEKSRKLTWSGLDYLYEELTRMKIPLIRSQGNFILFDTLRDASKVYEALLRKGIILRPVQNYGLPRHLRMTVGLKEENEMTVAVLKGIFKTIPEGRP